MNSKTGSHQIHYGWWVCLGSTLLIILTLGMLVNTSFAVFLPYIMKAGKYTGTQIGLIITIRTIFMVVGVIFLPSYYKALGYRAGMAMAAVIGAASLLVYGIASSIMIYYVGAILTGLAVGVGSMVPATIVLNRWFKEKKALAIGLCSAGTGIATMIMPTFLTSLIERYGTLFAFSFEAVFALVIGLLVFLLVRDTPEKVGCLPYGYSEDQPAASATQHVRKGGMELNRYQWIVAIIAMALVGAVSILSTANLPLLFKTSKIDSTMIGHSLSLMGLVLLFSKILFGKMSDRFGAFRITILFGIFIAIGLALAASVESFGANIVYLSVVFIGIGMPIALVGMPLWSIDFSTVESQPQTMKRFQMAYLIGGFIFSTVPGKLYDLTQSYRPAFYMISIFAIIIMLIVSMLYRAKSRWAQNS